MYCITSTIFVLQGKGRMTTYWLLGEKNPEGNNEAVEVGSGSGLSLGTENSQPEQLLSQQANAPSITRWAKFAKNFSENSKIKHSVTYFSFYVLLAHADYEILRTFGFATRFSNFPACF